MVYAGRSPDTRQWERQIGLRLWTCVDSMITTMRLPLGCRLSDAKARERWKCGGVTRTFKRDEMKSGLWMARGGMMRQVEREKIRTYRCDLPRRSQFFSSSERRRRTKRVSLMSLIVGAKEKRT